MTLIEAIIYGVVQGLTEFLPISSTAHLRIIPALLGREDPGAAFTAVIQCGTLAAVIVYFWSDIWRIASATLRGIARAKPLESYDARLGWMIVLGTVPIVACGFALKPYITGTLRSLYVVSAALIGLALVLAAAEQWLYRHLRAGKLPRHMEDLTWRDAVVVGLAQTVALVPGASRSGVTITGGLFCGLSRETAARFSFLLSLPSIFAAAMFELYHERHELLATDESTRNLVIATVVSGIVGYAAIAFLLGYLKNHSTWLFIVYRFALGGLLLCLLLAEYLAPLEGAK